MTDQDLPDEQFYIAPQVPDSEIVVGQVLITLTVDVAGNQGIYQNIRGNIPGTSMIGMLEVAKLELYLDKKGLV